jgi:class 3 adenylate cyclase
MHERDRDIRSILADVGLGDLAERFVAEHVDADLLRTLVDDDLKELGLTLGQRKRLLAHLRSSRLPAGPARGPAARPEDETPELRRLTVLFSDLAGSTELGERIPADEMYDLLRAYYAVARRAARQFGGFIASFQGDGVVMLFGYPQNRGKNGARAIGAALAMQEELAGAPHRLPDGRTIPINTRVGVASGPAVLGNVEDPLAGEGPNMVGPVVNRAARLQSVATLNTVVVDEETRAQAGDDFEFESLPPADLRGIGAAVPVSVVRGHRLRPAAPVRQATPGLESAGREAEAARLAECWRRAAAGEATVAILTGEAGIGKTALVDALRATVTGERRRVTLLACASSASNSPLGAIVHVIEAAIGRAQDGTTATRGESLRHLLGPRPEGDHEAVARLMGLAPAAHPIAGERERLLAVLGDWLVGTANEPALVVIEDVHWADATTRELLARCAAAAVHDRRPVFLLATSRASDEEIFADMPDRVTIPVAPLGADAAREVLDRALGGRSLPAAIRSLIVSRSGGNPLMLDTLARSFEEWSDLDLTRDVPVPNSIYDGISERLDRLTVGRAAASALAVLNGPADEALLALMLDTEADSIDAAVAELRREGVLAAPDPLDRQRLQFRHQLYREVAYERLVRTTRRALHEAALRALAALDPDCEEQQPGFLAWHAVEAGDFRRAVPLALKAGEQALTRSALIEAGHYLEQTLLALDRLEPSRDIDRWRMRALSALASVKRARLGIASDEVLALGREVLHLARALGDGSAELIALNGLYAHAVVRAEYRAARERADELAAAAQAHDDPTFRMISQRAVGVVALHTGAVAEAVDRLGRALDSYDIDRHLPLAWAHGYDHAEISAVFLSFALWLGGDLAGSRRVGTFAIDHSRRIEHAHSLAQALAFRAMLAALARDPATARAAGAEAVEVADRHDFKAMKGAGLFFGDVAEILAAPGAATAARRATLDANRVHFLSRNPFNYGPLTWILSAEVHLSAGDLAEAAAALDRADAVEARTGETWTRPELLRVRRALLVRAGAVDGARAVAHEALALAERHGAITLALRAACDIAEAERSDAALARLAALRARLVSADEGWDCRRCQALTDARVSA